MKAALSSIAALFGTSQIAANGVAQSIWTMAALVSFSMEPACITVIGQCMGARDIEQAEFYFRKLMKITLAFSIGWNILIFAVTPPLVGLYALSEETKRLTIQLVLIHNVFNAFAFTFADPLGKGLRATGDAFFTTAVSLFTTIVVRLLFSIILGICFNMDVTCYGHRLDRARHHLLGALQAQCLEEVPRDLGKQFIVQIGGCSSLHELHPLFS